MKKMIMALVVALAADAAFSAPVLVKDAATKTSAIKAKKKRGFKSLMARSASFVAQSAFDGGTADK